MNKSRLERAVRYLLIAMLAGFGANNFLHFTAMPEPPPEGGKFLGALGEAGYIFPTIGAVFLVATLLLALDRVALALLLVAPIAVNILGYHFKYDLPGTGAGGLLAALVVILALLHPKDIVALFRSSEAD